MLHNEKRHVTDSKEYTPSPVSSVGTDGEHLCEVKTDKQTAISDVEHSIINLKVSADMHL